MDLINNAPQQSHRPENEQVHHKQFQPPKKRQSQKTYKILTASLAVGMALIVLAVAASFFIHPRKLIKKEQYQAVFIDNGQVYFGKLSGVSQEYLSLKDVYYLQQQNNKSQIQSNTQDQKSKLAVVKLGKELHGPEDEMFIRRDKVLFWENLKDDSKVVQTIKNQQQ